MKDKQLEDRIRALNQLLSVIVGSRNAKETDALKSDPSARIRKCLELTLVEHKLATDSLAVDAETGRRAMAQCHRKLDSLQSLSVLAECVEISSWEPKIMGDYRDC